MLYLSTDQSRRTSGQNCFRISEHGDQVSVRLQVVSFVDRLEKILLIFHWEIVLKNDDIIKARLILNHSYSTKQFIPH